MPKAVLFDLDGVLIDSEPLWRAAEVEVLGALGVPITEADCQQTQGLRIDRAVAYWRRRHPWQVPPNEDVAAAIVGRVANAIRAEGSPLTGAMSAVRAVQHSGQAIAVATSSPWAIIEAVQERLGVQDIPFFSAADEAAGKPDPAVYLSAARALGIPSGRCLAVEDSEVGVAAAKAAGMRVVAVQPVSNADWVVEGTKLAGFLQFNWF